MRISILLSLLAFTFLQISFGSATSCQPGQYINWDGSCTETCLFPFQAKIEANGILTCQMPCESSDYFYENEEACRSTCEPPMLIKEEGPLRICATRDELAPLNPRVLTEAQELFLAVGREMVEILIVIVSFFIVSNPIFFTLDGFIKMFQYMRYISIEYPSRLDTMFINADFSLGSFLFGPSVPSQVMEKFVQYALPGKFGLYQLHDLHTRFLVNYWRIMTSLLIILIIISLVWVVAKLTKRFRFVNQIIGRIKVTLQFNLFLLMFCSNFDAVVLFTSLEDSPNGSMEVLSFIISLVINVLAFIVFWLIFHVIRDIRNHTEIINPKAQNPKTKWEALQFVYKGLKEDSIPQHSFILIALLRIYLFNIIIAYMYEHPKAQLSLILIMSVLMIVYGLLRNPFESKVVLFHHLLNEGLLLLTSIFMLVLASSDSTATPRNTIGDFVMGTNMCVIYSSIIFLGLYAFLEVGEFSLKKKVQRVKVVPEVIIAPQKVESKLVIQTANLDRKNSPHLSDENRSLVSPQNMSPMSTKIDKDFREPTSQPHDNNSPVSINSPLFFGETETKPGSLVESPMKSTRQERRWMRINTIKSLINIA